MNDILMLTISGITFLIGLCIWFFYERITTLQENNRLLSERLDTQINDLRELYYQQSRETSEIRCTSVIRQAFKADKVKRLKRELHSLGGETDEELLERVAELIKEAIGNNK